MESALDRFARTRGAAMVGAAAMGRQWKIQTAVGGVLLAAAGAVGIAPLLGAPAEVLYATSGPAIAGFINLGLGLYFRDRARQNGPGFALSDEAASLLRALVARAQVWQGGWRPRHAPMHGPHAWPGYRAPAQPSADAMGVLERAAVAHNRVTDVLGDAKGERAARLRNAVDAGMGEALHQTATGTGDVQGTVARLEELATLVEAAVERPEAPSVLRSNLEATIEELRAEAEAVRELRS